MRILFSANPMYGHVNPLLPLAAAAHRSGHAVLFAAGPDLIGHVQSFGVTATAVGPTYTAARSDPKEAWIPFFARLARQRARDLAPLVRSWAPDIVVHDETDLAGAVAAVVASARHVVHGLGMPPPARLWAMLRSEIRDLGTACGITGLDDCLSAATYVQPWPASLAPSDEAPCSRILPLRPTIADRTTPSPHPLTEAPLRHARSVHVTLGTVFNHNVELLRQIVHAVAELPVNVLVTTGPGVDPASLGAVPTNTHVHSYVPYDELLQRCSAVVSHAGAGVVLASLAHGLPQLLIPQGADQHGNATACVAAGAAISLDDADVDASAITTGVEALLDDPTYSASAATIGNEMSTMPDPESVVDQIAA